MKRRHSPQEAADLLGISLQSLYRLRRQGHLQADNAGTDSHPRWRFTEAQLEAFLAGKRPTRAAA